MSAPRPAAPIIRVLLVEDDETDVLLLREQLGEAPGHFHVVSAARLSEALAQLSAEKIDVILTDLGLPDSQGIETFRRLAAHPSRPPILVLTGLDDEEMALRTVAEGAQDFLVKGELGPALLVRSIRYAIERAAADQALQTERNLLRSVIDNLLDSIYVKDAAGRYLLGNAAHTRQLGLGSPEELVGRTSSDYFPADIARGFAADDAEVMRAGVPIINRQELVGGDHGAVQWVSTTKVPLRDSAGEVVGIVGIGRDITARKLAEERLAISAEKLREKNAEMEGDLQMAREVQQAFLPQQFPTFPRHVEPEESAVRFISRYLPTTTLCGDFFHVLPISDTRVGVFICDVMGHGVRAALVTAIERTLVEELKDFAEQPDAFLTQMNASLLAILRRTGSPMFVSAFYLVADFAAGTLRYANAGHPRALHLRRDAWQVDALGADRGRPGPALGVFDDSVYLAHEAPLAPRDLVLLFTDGLYEVEDARGELFDQSLLRKVVADRLHRSATQLFDELLDEVCRFSATGEFGDDVCLVALEVQRLLPPP